MTEEERQKLKIYCFDRQLIIFHIYGEKLIEDIKKAFSGNKYPGDENIVGCRCEECNEYYEFFVGRTWEECFAEESYGKVCGGQSFFKPLAWHYYLPAYLIQCIKHRWFRSSFEFKEFVDEDIPELIKRQKEEIILLTAKQCKVIVDYLETALLAWQGIEKGFEDNEKPLIFWKQNYQKALAKEKI